MRCFSEKPVQSAVCNSGGPFGGGRTPRLKMAICFSVQRQNSYQLDWNYIDELCCKLDVELWKFSLYTTYTNLQKFRIPPNSTGTPTLQNPSSLRMLLLKCQARKAPARGPNEGKSI